jgi:hypothetical protein
LRRFAQFRLQPILRHIAEARRWHNFFILPRVWIHLGDIQTYLNLTSSVPLKLYLHDAQVVCFNFTTVVLKMWVRGVYRYASRHLAAERSSGRESVFSDGRAIVGKQGVRHHARESEVRRIITFFRTSMEVSVAGGFDLGCARC